MGERRLNVSHHRPHELVHLKPSPKKGIGKANCFDGDLPQTAFSLYRG